MSTILCFSVNMGCCVYINEEKMNLNDFSKWLQYNRVKNLRGSEYFQYPLYIYIERERERERYAVACESLGTHCRICENLNNFNKIRGGGGGGKNVLNLKIKVNYT